ncbi:MAG TPA: molybdopterin-dependent oxidoreductase [Burkholderiaceae bacterium]|nr:molybdopterin-dependent oxidoreductase [Burkholderiaceae bacterium]
MAETRSTCCYCGVGCGVLIEHGDGRITGVRGDPDHPANRGRLCTKGATLHLTAVRESRALFPELRDARDAARRRVGWDEALATAAGRFAAVIREHGPDAVAFYLSGQLLTEDYYVFNKLARALVGTNNVDSNSRLCMSSAVAGYKMTLGADAPPACYEDIDVADCILIAGSNAAYAHPILYRRIEDAKARNPQLRIIVVDPRRTDTAAGADLHLPVLPGTDLVLFSAMLHVLLWEGLVDWRYIREHTEGFDALREAVRELTPAHAARICGVDAEAIVTAARWFGTANAALSLWCQGLNQSVHGTHNTAAIVHLHLATGQIGRPGAGPLSLTGQPNAMGGREVGAMANLAPAHRDLGNPDDRDEVARLWGVPSLPANPGRSAVELFDAVARGEIRAVWIACTNPAQSLPNQARVREALQRAEFVVLQEAFVDVETAPYADLLLPAASWGEKEGTVTNSERRITRVRSALPPPGQARADWRIARDFARALGHALERGDAARLFDFADTAAVFREHAATTRGRDLDISALGHAELERDGPQQWPYRDGRGTARLYADARFATPGGRARFVPIALQTLAEDIDARFPLHLNTGRLRDQWHGMSRTGKVARLFNHADEARLSMHRDDLARRGIADGDLARVRSRRGEIVVRVAASEEMRAGQVFLPMHFGRRYLSHAGANELMPAAFDPHSRQPELKHAAVQVERAVLPHQELVLRSAVGAAQPQEVALRWMARLHPLLSRYAYASLALAGREMPAVVLRIAHGAATPDAWREQIDALLEMPDEACLRYRDARRNVDKKALIVDGRLAGVRLTGEVAAAAWLREMMTQARPAADLRRWILAPLAAPPSAARSRGRVVCNCLDVAESQIDAAIGGGADLPALQQQLRCGTSCGSCVPEIKRMLAARGHPLPHPSPAGAGEGSPVVSN